MAGLMDGGMGTPPMARGFNGEDVEDDTPNVSEAEQQQYDAFVENAMRLMYTEDGQVLPELMQRLRAGKPQDALAQSAVWVTMLTENSAKQNQQPIADEVLFHAGKEILEQLAEIVEASGYHEFKEGELQGAWYSALDMYREANTGEGGRFNPEEAAAQFEALNEADQQGRADEIIPGFSELPQAAFAGAMEQEGETEEDG